MGATRSPAVSTDSVSWEDVAAGTGASIVMGALAGGAAGLVWGGIGGRVAMRVIFLTSHEGVRGFISDDGFEIGQITFSTLVLLIGTTIVGGFLGACYGLLRMLLMGSLRWLCAGVMIATGAFGGGAVVKADGIDFRLLEPLWLAVAMFVALPALWGATVPLVTERLLDVKALFPERMEGVDAKPFGRAGSIAAWVVLAVLAVVGVFDLVHDLERLA